MRAVTARAMWNYAAVAACMAVCSLQAAGADPVELRYRWEAGARHAYEVKITADHGEAVETLTGTPILVVESADGGQARMRLENKQLGSITQPKNPGRVRIPAAPRIPNDLGRGFRGHELTLDTRGRVINQRGESQLPFVLGNLAQILIEPLPAGAVESWTQTESTTIRISSEWPPRSPFRRDVEQERLNAEETTTFKITDVSADVVVIQKEYRLATIETVKDQPRMELAGSGEITFDRRRQLPTALEYKANFIVREDNQEVKHPLTVTYRLLSAEELAAHDERVAAAAAEMKAAPTGEQREALLADLSSQEVPRGRKALIEIQPKEPADQADAELAAALANWLSSDEQSLRHLAAQALEKWGTSAEIPQLLTALDDGSPTCGELRHESPRTAARDRGRRAARHEPRRVPVAARRQRSTESDRSRRRRADAHRVGTRRMGGAAGGLPHPAGDRHRKERAGAAHRQPDRRERPDSPDVKTGRGRHRSAVNRRLAELRFLFEKPEF